MSESPPTERELRLQSALEAERERHAALLAAVPGVVWESVGHPLSEEARVVFVSDHALRLVGSPEPMEPRPLSRWIAHFHPADRDRVAREAAAVFETGGKGTIRFRWISRSGRVHRAATRLTTFHGPDGAPAGLRGVTFDVSAEVLAERDGYRAIAEQVARAESDAARRRLAFLAAASAELASSLDLEVTLRRVGTTLVPEFADWCAVYLREGDDLVCVAVAHPDPASADRTRALLRRYPPVRELHGATWEAMRTGRTQLVPDIDDAALAAASVDAEHLAGLRATKMRSAMGVQLPGRNGPLGALNLYMGDSGRRFTADDRSLMEEFGQRLAVAIENAVLYAEREQATRDLQLQARRQEEMARLGHLALTTSSLRDFLDAAVEAIGRSLCAEVAAVREVLPDGRLALRASFGFDSDAFLDPIPADPAGSLSGFALHARRTVVCEDLRVEARFRAPVPDAIGDVAAGMGAPMTLSDEQLGAIVVFWRNPRRLTADEQRFLESVTHLVAASYQRDRQQEALAREKERLAVTLRSIAEGVVATDMDGRVVLLNAIAEAMTGWPQDDAAGRPVAEVFRTVDPASRATGESPFARVLAGGTVGTRKRDLLVARDGTEHLIVDAGAPIRDGAGRAVGVVLVFRDVGTQDRLDAELQRTNTLASVGVLAGGIAHDFNNLLTGILANLSLARLGTSPTARAYARLTDAEKATLRARDLTRQLLTFAKGGSPVRTPTSLGEVVRETVGFCLTGSNVAAELDVPGDLRVTDVDPAQIGQVVQNLVMNAQQAMPNGGTVEVRLRNVDIGEPTELPLAAGPYVRLDVRDTGDGVAREHLARIFDPFFTTKAKGSGLGLATSWAIVRKHDGHITVDSRVGEGACFSVYLPAAAGAAASSAMGEPTPLPVGSGRVLVMDDEDLVRVTLRRQLELIGYEVETARDGNEAVRMWRENRWNGRGFDLVVLDLTVPGAMGGRETLEELRKLDPDVRAIVSSGYSEDAVLSDFRAYGFIDALRKPYTLEELGVVLARIRPSGR